MGLWMAVGACGGRDWRMTRGGGVNFARRRSWASGLGVLCLVSKWSGEVRQGWCALKAERRVACELVLLLSGVLNRWLGEESGEVMARRCVLCGGVMAGSATGARRQASGFHAGQRQTALAATLKARATTACRWRSRENTGWGGASPVAFGHMAINF